MKVSAVVLTLNEEKNIVRCLRSLAWADEVLVIDSGSTDSTIALAKDFPNASVIETEWLGFSANKQIGIDRSHNDWVFWVDADEEVTPSLRAEIESMSTVKVDAFAVRRKNYFMGKAVNHSGWGNDVVIRLFDKDRAHLDGNQVHEKMIVNGTLGRLKGKLNHFTYQGLDHYLKKHNDYTTKFALQHVGKKEAVGMVHLWGKPIFRFIRQFLLNKGFLDGKVGLVIAMLSAYSVFMKYLKLWRLQQSEPLTEQ